MDIQGYQISCESGNTRSDVDEFQSWDIQQDQVEGESGVTGSIIEELGSWDIQVYPT